VVDHGRQISSSQSAVDGGDAPGSPTDLPRSSMVAVLKRTRHEFKNDNLTDLAAALTYYAILSVVPGLIVLVSVLGLAGRSTTQQVVDQVKTITPGSSAKVVQTLITQAQSHRGGAGAAAIAGVVVALWSASGYVAAFMRASNRVYAIGEGRPVWKTAPVRLGVTIVAVVFLVAMAVIVVVTGPVAKAVGDTIGAGSTAVLIWDIVKWPILLLLISVLLAILFWASPNAKQAGIKWVSPGGIAATILWLVLSALFALYVTDFSSYDRTYGSLAGIVVFLIWLWLSNLALLLGAEINAELEHGRAIATGLPAEVRPFAKPRDTRKLSPEDKTAVERAKMASGGG
jgi:membrane protein